MSDSINKKNLANLIKADLRDFLNNKKRLDKGWYFFPYEDMSGKIWVIENRGKGGVISSEMKNLVRENALANASRRQKVHEKLWAEEIERLKKRGITLKNKKFKLDEKEIWQEELEKEDYDEIVNLISQVKQARDSKKQTQRREREEKLAANPHLFYWSGNGHVNPRYINEWKNEKYRYFGGKTTEKECRVLNINSLHPALNNFPFEKAGFYIIEGTDNLPWEPCVYNGTPRSSRDNFNKHVELNDKITITPYHDNSEPRKTNNKKKIFAICNKCGADYQNIESWYYWCDENQEMSSLDRLSWFCGECWKTEEKNYRYQSSPKNTVHKNEPQKDNLGDEHDYYFENGHWISLESGTPDPNLINSEGKISRLVTLVDSIQPPSEGKDRSNWDYFYYVFATENGERFEINSLNPAIGFDAGTKKEHFQRAGNNGIRFWYKITWKATEPDKRRFEKGDFIEIEKWKKSSPNNNIGDKSQKNEKDKKLSISIISEFFREWNIKSIEITSSKDLFIEYNNGSSETIKNDERGTGIIKNNLNKILNKTKLDQQELEKLLTGSRPQKPTPNDSPKKNYTPYLIGGGIILIIAGVVLISYRFTRKLKKVK